MSLRYLQFLAVLLWGVHGDLILFAIPMGLVLEARFFFNRRWSLTRKDFYQIADLTNLALVGLLTFLFINRAEYHFISTLLLWLPLLFFPLVVVIAYSTTQRMPLDILFYSLRRQREPVTQSWDMNYVFFGLCLVSAGTGWNDAGFNLYFIATTLLVLLCLFRLRSSRYTPRVWLLAACVVFLAANFTQQAIREGHLALKAQSRAWLAEFIRNRTNPLKTKSAIGAIGRLKSSDTILFRLDPGVSVAGPGLLQEASYDVPSDNNWVVLNPRFETVAPAGDFLWSFPGRSAHEARARIYLEFDREQAIVPVPATLTEVFDLPATELRLSKFGSLQALGLVPSPGFDVSYGPPGSINPSPSVDRSDLYVPAKLNPVLDEFIGTIHGDPLSHLSGLFRDFRYSLYQEKGQTDEPLVNFLLHTRAGHCEYFASTAVLLLRQMGVPARYVVGYAVQEFEESIGMYVIRERHAHAWAIAYIEDRWVVVDMTPQIWAEAEAAQASVLRPLLDFMANRAFLVQLWWNDTTLEDFEIWLYLIGAALALTLAWRILRSEQVTLPDPSKTVAGEAHIGQGLDSPFFRIEQYNQGKGLVRERGESFSRWLARIDLLELLPLLKLHNRYRFDPRGLDEEERTTLVSGVQAWLERETL